MPADVIVGAQWGDEGKGRVADWLAGSADVVARYAGGDNAGHTVRIGDDTFKLHLVPSGVIRPNTICVMGGGMVINPLRLTIEIKGLAERGCDVAPGRLVLSETAHIITPGHLALDGADEEQRGAEAIGTTKRGIGPAYTDKAARTGIRTGAMRNPEKFVELVRAHIERCNALLSDIYHVAPVDPNDSIDELYAAAEFLAPYLANTSMTLNEALQAGKHVLCEGAQGTLLDVDHGIYPYVTSSTATVGGALTGLGIGPRYIDKVIGVSKAYSTRVGGGPFPTEQLNEIGDRLRGTGKNPWDEFGTTTGRPRRCGWLDTMVIRYAARINGLTDLVITKLDVLSGLNELQIADRYTRNGAVVREAPSEVTEMEGCVPEYETLPGWQADIMGIRKRRDLPAEAQGYIHRIEELTNVRVMLITVGPARDQTIADA